jgi:hypothetical protein
MKILSILFSALLLLGGCSKENACGSTKGNIEVYSSTYGGILIYGNDGKTEAIFTAGTTTSFPKEQGKYQIAYYDNKYKYTFDSVDLKACETVKLTY